MNATAAVAAVGGGPPPTSCPAGYTEHVGTLSGTGTSAYLPSTAGYVTTVTGLHSGRLTGPSNADFDAQSGVTSEPAANAAGSLLCGRLASRYRDGRGAD